MLGALALYGLLIYLVNVVSSNESTESLVNMYDVSTLEMIGMENSSNIDFNFGMYLFNDRFDYGLSIANLKITIFFWKTGNPRCPHSSQIAIFDKHQHFFPKK